MHFRWPASILISLSILVGKQIKPSQALPDVIRIGKNHFSSACYTFNLELKPAVFEYNSHLKLKEINNDSPSTKIL